MKKLLSKDEVLRSMSARVSALLDMLDTCGTPGSVVIEIHRDQGGVRKVRISHEENWDCANLFQNP